MGICYGENCLNETSQKCSSCKSAYYCGKSCQTTSWPNHKEECKMNRLLNQIQEKEVEGRKKLVEKPRTTHCTGCNVKFSESEEYDAGNECSDCGYIACESCVYEYSNGSCYCENSNFGYPYCKQPPHPYHMSSRTGRRYQGDRHSNDPVILEKGILKGVFEEEPRECSNCGEIGLCLKKGFL